MSVMFSGCSSLASLDLSSFNTSNVMDMRSMFNGCSSLTSLDLSSFNTSNVTDMSVMFSGCSSLASLDLSSFNTSNVTDMSSMFYYSQRLKTVYVSDKWDISNLVDDGEEMFSYCYSLVGEKGTKYNSNHIDSSYAHVDGGEGNPGYFTYKEYTVPDGINMIISDVWKNKTFYYNLKGQQSTEPQHGINIIRYKNGTNRKVLMK